MITADFNEGTFCNFFFLLLAINLILKSAEGEGVVFEKGEPILADPSLKVVCLTTHCVS